MTADPSILASVNGTELLASDTRDLYRQKLARITLDSMVQFVSLLDAAGTVLEINQVALDAVGINLADVEGRPFWTTYWWQVSEETNATLRDSIRRAAQGEFVRWDAEIFGRAGGKETIIVDASLTPVRDEQGNVVFITGEGRDITEKKANEREIARQREELAKLDELKTQFFANISHEFRTPLTLMMGPLQDAMAEPKGLSAPNRERLELAHRNSQRLLRLVNTLLDFSRIEAGRAQALYEPTDLAHLTAELASGFRSTIERARMRLVVDCPPLSDAVYVDREMWEKIVLNLISNAFKFTFHGEIEVSLREVGSAVQLTVCDTGTGIPAQDIPRLFDRFHRVKDARGRSYEGSGIGLALVQELVRMHGGKVQVESELGRGSRFIVTIAMGKSHLPPDRINARRTLISTGRRSDAYAEEILRWLPDEPLAGFSGAGPAEAIPVNDHSGAGHKEGHLLLADDNADMRDYLRHILSDRYEVEAVSNGAQALKAVHRRAPDLILSDVMMPELDGFSLIRKLRASPSTASIPLILLSARSGEESRVEGLDAGADDYLVKPFTARDLRARVSAHLKLARARKHAEEQSTRILESIADGFCALDRDWRFIYFNRAAEKILGISRQEIIGQNYWELFPETLGTLAESEYRRAVRDNVPVEFEHFLEPLQMWFSVRAYPGTDGGLSIYLRDVTEQRRASELLQAAQSELRLVADAAPVYLAHSDRDGRYLFVNRPYAERFGLNVEDIVGKRLPEVLGEAAWSNLRQYLDKVFEGEALDFEIPIPYKGIGERFMHVSYVPDRDANGDVRGVVAAVTDITARKRTEDALHLRERQLQILFDAAPIGIYMVDAHLCIRQVNPTARPIFGEVKDVIGRDLSEVLSRLWQPEFAAEIIGWFRHTLETGEPYFVDERAEERRDSGATEYYKWQLNRIYLPDGEPGVVCYFFDISASVLAQHALARSEEKFRTLAENMSQFAWMTDETGWVFWYNQRWYEYTGTTFEDMQGWGWITALHPEHAHRVLAHFRQSIEKGEGWEDTFPLQCRDGEYGWFLSRAHPIRDASGRILRWFGTNTDVTLQRNTEEALRRANQELEQFAYSASHDLQEPLRQVAVYSQLVEKKLGDKLDGKGSQYLAHLIDGAHRMEVLINDLLAYSRTATCGTACLCQVDMNDVLSEVTKTLETVIEESGAVISATGLPVISCDAVPMVHLFQNLLSNALKYRSDQPPRVTITAKEQSGSWLFAVQDNGIGIPKGFQTQIFGIFKRLHDRQAYPGTGLGLAICQKVVERCGGRIWVESEEGKGSTFFFTLHRAGTNALVPAPK